MKLILVTLIISLINIIPVSAQSYIAPVAPGTVQDYMPDNADDFGSDLWYIIKKAINTLRPNLAEACRTCFSIIVFMLLISIIKSFEGMPQKLISIVCSVCTAMLLINSTNSFILKGAQNVSEINDYGKLLLPVITASLAAQGGVTASGSLYVGTSIFSTILSTGIVKFAIPLLYFYMVLSIGYSAIGEDVLKNLRDFIKWLITWCLKIILYIFTGYLSITGVISGATDAAALKATKITVSGMVPVVGSIVADASETILAGAGIIKNSIGIYGLLVIVAIWIAPFLQIGTQYLLLKMTASVCNTLGPSNSVGLLHDFSSIMGILVAMSGTVCLLYFVSIVCYLKGVG